MKGKRILAGMLVGVLAVTSVPGTGLNAYAAGNGELEVIDDVTELDAEGEASYNYMEVAREVLYANATANSEQWPAKWTHDGPAEYAFNGDTSNWWHGRYNNDDGKLGKHHPEETRWLESGEGAWIGSGFGRRILLGQITYRSRTDDNSGGRIWKYELYTANVADGVTPTDDDFTLVSSGNLEANKWKNTDTIQLDAPVEATHFRLKAIEMHDSYNVNEATASEIKVYEAVAGQLTELKTKIAEVDAFLRENGMYDCGDLERLAAEAQDMVVAGSADEDVINAKIAELTAELEKVQTNFQKVFKDENGAGVYLSDLDWTSESSGWEDHPSRKDQGVDDDTIALYDGGKWNEYAKGIGTHAPSAITYDLEGKGYQRFETYAGVNNDHNGSVKFKVYVDDVLKFETPDTVYRDTGMVFVSVDVRDAATLTLEVTDEGGNGNDHAAWADAKLYTSVNAADKEALKTAIAEANAKLAAADIGNYTDESVENLREKLAAAETVEGKSDAKQRDVDAAADALTTALESLLLKDADYTAVDAALEEAANADRSDKTDESLAVLDAAVEAVVRDKKITEQAEVDAMAEAITKAVAALAMDEAKVAAKELAAAKAALEAKIAEAEAFIENNSAYDCIRLQALVEEAQALMDAEDIDVSVVNEKAEELGTAMTDFQKVFSNEEGKGVYLSDMDWNEGSYSGWESIQKDKSVNENPIRLYNGSETRKFLKGIGTHAASEIVYDLSNQDYQVFETWMGADTEEDQSQKMTFAIYVDDVLVYESGEMGRWDTMKHAVVDVRGAKTLKLVVNDLGDKSGDHADWADAKLYTEVTSTRNVTVTAGEGGTAEASQTGDVPFGTKAVFTATADSGYQFVNWTNKDGAEVSKDSVYTAIVTENMELTANFAQITYQIRVGSDIVAEGCYNTKVTITAPEAPEGQKFAGWEVNGKMISKEPQYTFYIANSMEFTAKFVDEEEAAEMTPSANITNTILTKRTDGKTNIKFAAQLVVPEGCTVVETGLLWCSKDTPEVLAENGEIAAGVKKTVSPSMNKSYQFSVTINGVPTGRFVRGMIYAQVRNKETNEVTWIYSGETKAVVE